jgi:L-alanine-DL-glutamate epimerase-like enolase superfamily enzyme
MTLNIQWFEFPLPTRGGSRCLLLAVHANNHFGLGEVRLSPGAPEAGVFELLHACAPHLAGSDPRNINSVLAVLSAVLKQDAQAGPLVLSALDVALHDLNGRLRGCPVHAVLGGSFRSEVALSHRLGFGSDDFQESETKAVRLDYRHQHSGQRESRSGATGSWTWIAAAVGRYESEVQVDIDAQGSFENPAVARTFVEGLLADGPRMNLGLQQPLRDTDLIGHALLRSTLPIPIILDSSIRSAEITGQVVRLGAADRIVLNVERVGGLRAATNIASLAEAASIGVAAASFAETAVGAAAALHLAVVLKDSFPAMLDNYAPAGDAISDPGFTAFKGRTTLESRPGLGIVLPDGVLAAFRPVA